MSPFKAFNSCRSRIDRAEAHAAKLTKLWEDFIKDDPYEVFVHINRNGKGKIVVQCRYDPFPVEFSLLLGEILYQLRAALDACVYAAGVQSTGQDPPPDYGNLGFKICDSRRRYKKRTKSYRVLPKRVRVLIECVQPYKRIKLKPEDRVRNANYLLDILDDWSVKDRHHRLHVMASLVSDIDPMLRLPEECDVVEWKVARDGLLKRNHTIVKFRLSGYRPGMKVQANPNLSIQIAVNDTFRPRASNDTFVNRLNNMILTVQIITAAIEDAFHKPKAR